MVPPWEDGPLVSASCGAPVEARVYLASPIIAALASLMTWELGMHDLVITNGTVVDGTGASARRADVAISDGLITEVGDLSGQQAQRTIDADGHIVSPGFVDVHTHMDAQIAWDPLGECSCFHGVTTAVMGNCGFTLAPVNSDARELVVRNLERAEDISADAMAAGIDWSWETFPEYLDFVDATPKGINYAGYVGHSALRTWAMGERAFEEAANDDDISKMAAQVQASMRAGAIGFTTSVSGNHETSDDRPVASRFASRDEINALVQSMADLGPGGIFELAQHPDMRSPDPAKREDYARWLIDLAVSTGVPLTYGMLAFGTEDHKWKPVVELLDRITAEGGTAWGQAHSRHFGAILSFQTQLPFDALPVWKELPGPAARGTTTGARRSVYAPATDRYCRHRRVRPGDRNRGSQTRVAVCLPGHVGSAAIRDNRRTRVGSPVVADGGLPRHSGRVRPEHVLHAGGSES